MYLSPRKKLFVDTATEMFGVGSVISKAESIQAAKSIPVPNPTWFWGSCKVGYNKFELPSENAPVSTTTSDAPSENVVMNLVATNMEKQDLVPSPFEGFVPWGNYGNLKKIIKSGMFYPVFVTGLSGNGKTLMVEQLHAELKKELIRINITIETDEDDLLGGFRLVTGETKFVPGPVIEAMERGCTLFLMSVILVLTSYLHYSLSLRVRVCS